MRRLLLAAALTLTAGALPAAPAHAGAGACVVTSGVPVCAGTCSYGDAITVITLGVSATGRASCGGTTVDCAAFKVPCTDSGTATGSGALSCSGTAPVVICLVLPSSR